MSERILVAYGTRHRATAEIAGAIGEELRAAGLEVDVRPAREVRTLDPYGAVVLGSAVYLGRWRHDAMRLLRHRARELAERPVWLFSSGPVGDQPTDTPEAQRWLRPARVEELAGRIGAREHAVFGGMVAEDAGFARKRMARDTAPEHRDLRDWEAIRSWARTVAAQLPST